MKKYTIKRILTSFFTLMVILLVLFILMQLMPGSPFNDEKLNDDQRAALYVKYGLDQPVAVQFINYAKNMLLAESKGISGAALIFRHALRNALIPIITVLAPLIVDLMTGSLVVDILYGVIDWFR